MPKALIERTEFYNIWRKFIDKGATEGVPESIKASWKRCLEMGVDPRKEIPSAEPLSQNMIQKRLDDHSGLHKILQYYQKNIEQYFDFIPLSMFFCDKEGFILSLSGHDELLKMLEEGGGTEGYTINESAMGTTAPGISLIEQEPSIVCAEERCWFPICTSLLYFFCASTTIAPSAGLWLCGFST